MYKKRELRTCKTCHKEFWFRLCYAKRLGAGKYCSAPCRNLAFTGSGNPRAGKYAEYGSKRSEHLRQLANYQRYKLQALEKLARLYNSRVQCRNCECDHLPLLQINHLQRRQIKNETGAKLWRLILRLSDEEAKQRFDIRCQICNWLYSLEERHAVKYDILWRGKVEDDE